MTFDQIETFRTEDVVGELATTLRDDWAASTLTRSVYADDVVFDGQFPNQLVRWHGIASVERELRADAAGRFIEQWEVHPTATGFVVEYGVHSTDTPSLGSVGLILVTIVDGSISRLLCTCAGAWDAESETQILAARDGAR